jgi:DNA anti-recombination protein RmuC
LITAKIQRVLLWICLGLLLAVSIGLWVLRSENADLTEKNATLEQSNEILASRIQDMKRDHDQEIERISKLDRARTATATLIAPLFTQSDMLAFIKEAPDAPTDRFVRDANALNDNLVRLLEQTSR